jgi:hypothetical protein
MHCTPSAATRTDSTATIPPGANICQSGAHILRLRGHMRHIHLGRPIWATCWHRESVSAAWLGRTQQCGAGMPIEGALLFTIATWINQTTSRHPICCFPAPRVCCGGTGGRVWPSAAGDCCQRSLWPASRSRKSRSEAQQQPTSFI